MKNPRFILRLVLVGFLLTAPVLQTLGVIFTTNTVIGPLDSNYDGTDIVISNCTVTLDGPHTFAGIWVASGGVLTHSFSPNGASTWLEFAYNEPHVLNGTNPVTLLHTNAYGPATVKDASQPITYSNGVDYVETDLPDGTIQIARTETSSIAAGATVLVSYGWDYITPAGLNLTVTGDVAVASGGSIAANGIGYGGAPSQYLGIGPGGGSSSGGTYFDGSGGGHGGNGGNSSSNAVGGVCYDSLYQPTLLGSGGGASYAGSGANGGGAVHIAATGNVDINGVISANGADAANDRAGGGSGGGIWISAASVSGTGSIMANGGAGAPMYGGGGGGGRIAIQCGTNNFSGTMTAYGGNGYQIGGAGTIFTQLAGQTGLLLVDNGGRTGANSTVSLPTMADVMIRGDAGVVAVSPFNSSNLTVSTGSVLTGLAQSPLTLLAAGNLTIQAGGALTLDGLGYAAGTGPGAGQVYLIGNYYFGGGGGHGGFGAAASATKAAGGSTYDSQTVPDMLGSGGGNSESSVGGTGGGAIRLTVAGTLQVEGALTADGINGSGIAGGGGSGGSIYVNAATLGGSGSITANGGNGAVSFGGGGGGGRIAIVTGTNLYAGNLAAAGGGGANWGGAGTVYLQAGGAAAQLVLDNAGHTGAVTPVQSAQGANLIVQNGAVGAATSVTFAGLLVGSNAWLLPSVPIEPENFAISGNVTIEAGGGIVADADGYPANQGAGHGYYAYYPYQYAGSGAGHGGYGGNSISNSAAGGMAGYDSIPAPNSPGSGGGGYLPYSIGGSGGGAIQMNVSGALRVDGLLSANGGNGTGLGGGGGAGGSLNLTVGGLVGSGVIAANGGNGADGVGGGGGGGIIAVNLNQSNSFAGTFSAFGGSGANVGGAGTILINTNFALPPGAIRSLLLVDNAGHHGTNTPINYSSPNSGLVLRNGAVAVPNSSSLGFSSLLITSNAWLVGSTANNLGAVNLTVFNNATIQAGGGIVADASGYAQNHGPGAGRGGGNSPWFACSGAGHGGYGALGLTNQVPGGSTYGSTASPSALGSGGGGYAYYSIGGAGGGYVNLHVNGLQLDGVISANGGNGSGSGGGGGSGGSIYIEVPGKPGAFVGSGSITANGGNGANGIGGGGGGGRITIYSLEGSINPPPTNNVFAGIISAYGGGGANWGGAGTIFYQTNLQGYPLLLLDNDNHAGTNTSFDFTRMNATIQNGAVGLLPVSGLWAPINLLIRTNGLLTAPASGFTRIINANAITIEAGGAISLDGGGNGPQSGLGAGEAGVSLRGGGGHGGYGGGNGPTGGNAYDSIPMPSEAGSGGASDAGQPYSYGGYGGGALELNANTITVNGRLSADGNSGGYNSGGGAGGALYLNAYYPLAGNGVISANGGAASGAGGGGGGGRIALICSSNNFTGQLSAAGGGGAYPGGAGTIFTRVSSLAGDQTLLVDNAGQVGGTNTPLSSAYSLPTTPFDLDISGGATIVPLRALPLLRNLNLAAGSTLTMPFARSNLFIAVLKDANLAGDLNVDHLGYGQTNGPGAGSAIGGKGSGGGYGGAGGASSSGAPGGAAYGSAAQPVDLGSGGGNGASTVTGGSDGGGALRLSVAGALNLNGRVSANGNPGAQDDSGGGSGGSVWISASSLSGAGNISAVGGDGAPLGGGGGGGGRIAIYAPTNHFTGTTNVNGGTGVSPGQAGTVFFSTVLAGFQVVSQSPTGLVTNAVSDVDLGFNEALDPASVLASNFTLVTPAGALAASNISVTITGPAAVRVSFPAQNLPGDYTIQAATTFTNIFGLPLAQAYTGTFSIPPTISGTVTDTNGTPIAGVLLQPDGGLTGVTTDTNGNYALDVPPGWNGTVTPVFGSFMFVPGALAYTNVTVSLTNQNYLMVPTVAPDITARLNGTNFSLNWSGLSGVTYQLLRSTNLVDWQPMGSALPGTNGPMRISLPLGTDPADFFRLNAAH